MDFDWIARSAGIALALSVAACVWLARLVVKLIDARIELTRVVAELTAALKEANGQVERLLRNREK